jgi:hypothetical protein
LINASFKKARQGGDGIDATKLGRGVKIMQAIDASGLPVPPCSANATPQ